MKVICQRIVAHIWFERFIVGVILFNALLLGLETSQTLYSAYSSWMSVGQNIVLFIFIVEAGIKIRAVAPNYRLYFGDGWNLFDFSIVVLSLIPFSGPYAMIARLLSIAIDIYHS